MATLKDIAQFVAVESSSSTVDIDVFLQQFVEVINDGLKTDGEVTIHDLGTFKRIGKSVTFTPEETLRDIINAPFASFQTITLNDKAIIDPEQTAPEEQAIDEPKEELQEVIQEAPPEPQQEQQQPKTEATSTNAPSENCKVVKETCHDYFVYIAILINIIIAILAFIIGYLVKTQC